MAFCHFVQIRGLCFWRCTVYVRVPCYVVVTVDELAEADDDQAPMSSAPPIAMDAIQGYDAIAMDDGRCEH